MLKQQEWTIYKTVSQNLLFLLYLKKKQKTLKKMIKKLKEKTRKDLSNCNPYTVNTWSDCLQITFKIGSSACKQCLE